MKKKASKRPLPVGALLALVLGMSMVAAGAGLVLSNVLTWNNNVPENAITLTRVDVNTSAMGGDYPNLPDSPVKGMVYDLGVQIVGNQDAGMAKLQFTVTKGGIDPSNITVEWWNVTAWTNLTFTDNGDGSIVAYYGPDAGFDVVMGYDVIVAFRVTMNASGDYSTEVVAVSA